MAETGGTNYESKYQEDDDVVVDEDMVKLAKFTKLISPLFLVFGLFSLGLMIMSIFKVDQADGWVTFFVVIVATIVFSIIAALGVYKWGTVEEQIDIFKGENQRYETEIESLKNTKGKLSGEVKKLKETTNSLNRDVDTLKATLSQYDELKKSLEGLCDDNETVNELINEVNDMYLDMKNTILSNTRAGILSAYYDAALRDDTEGMNRKEYKRFLARLDVETRDKFKAEGTFEEISRGDGLIDLGEFQRLVDDILAGAEDQIIQKQADEVSSDDD